MYNHTLWTLIDSPVFCWFDKATIRGIVFTIFFTKELKLSKSLVDSETENPLSASQKTAEI